ncbi:TetR/AcrR family transcriptional regulator [Parvibaculum sp.]|uniref:TetR/AcrR family transcriptional regulator n=1 Tax=Parvibaculum sp. TaxID=2024848 RepID=UPI002730346E|nr:TetR/AcrR family transcriptional regulator [Parvibaculum sp.]MDP1626950.1 TetR/AcrR family transcriptional regulator [Parvibaculum sp.]MDP2151654.1 TetR/AcrR family transcriptional regulator [Parvibaculum sp.]MDP3327603.1 TetR/AcrR family transcriptional regulator [Parvibaculum sp.]
MPTAAAARKPAAKRRSAAKPESAPRLPRDAKPKTHDLILDTAERLFAERGFFGVSVRDITEAADIRLASVNYHFGTKDELLKAVVERRFREIDADRRARFAELEPKLARMSKREIVEAVADIFLLPILDRVTAGDPGWTAYAQIIAHGSNVKMWATGLLASVLDPVARDFIALLARAYPKASDHALYCAYELMTGAMAHALGQNGRLDTLSNGKYRSSDLAKIHPRARAFAVGGIMAVCEAKAS